MYLLRNLPGDFELEKKYLTQLCFLITVLEFYCFFLKKKEKPPM